MFIKKIFIKIFVYQNYFILILELLNHRVEIFLIESIVTVNVNLLPKFKKIKKQDLKNKCLLLTF